MTSLRSTTVALIVSCLAIFTFLIAGCGKSTPDTIAIDPDSTTVAVGQTQQFSATGRDTKGRDIEALDIIWSTDGAAGRVDATGLFTAVKAGTATVTASAADAKGTVTVTVIPEPIAKLVTTIAPATVIAGQAAKVTVTATNAAGSGVADAVIAATANSEGTGVEPATATTHASGQAVFTITTPATVQHNQITLQGGDQQVIAAVQTQPGPPATVELTTEPAQIAAGATGTIHVLVLDQAKNPVPNATVQLDAGSSGTTVTPAQVTTDDQGRASAILQASSSAGVHQLQANVANLSSQPFQLHSPPGAPAKVIVQASTQSMIAGGAVDLSVSVQDTYGNGIPEATIQVDVSAADAGLGATTLTSDHSGSAATTLTLSTTPGAQTVEATLAGVAPGRVTIMAQPPETLQVEPKTVTLEMLATHAFQATAIDAEGHALSISPQWRAVGSNGLIDAAGVFTAQGIGTETIVATYADLKDGAQIEIVPGQVARVEVTPAEASVTAATNFQFTATAYNAQGHPLDVAVQWGVSNDLGTIDAVGLLAASKSGEGEVTATAEEQTGRAKLTVTSGPLATVAIEPAQVQLRAGEEVQLKATGYDASGNEVPVDSSWALMAELGDMLKDGTFQARHSGTGEIQVKSGPMPVISTVPVQVTPADLNRIQLEPKTLSATAGDQHLFSATGYDAFDNRVEITPVWSLSTEDIAQIDDQGSLYARKTGSVDVIVTVGEFTDSADVTVKPSQLARLTVQPQGPLTLTAGTIVSFTLNGYDAFENPLALSPTWSQSTQLGSFPSDHTFRAETVGSGEITVQQDDQRLSIPVTVTTGNLARIAINPTGATLQAGNTITWQAKGLDAYDNNVIIYPTWRVTQSIGEISKTGEFKALRAQKGDIIATADGVSEAREIEVVPGPLTLLRVTPAQLNLKGGDTAEITVIGYDEYGNPSPIQPTWKLPDGMGTMTGSTITALKAGTGRIIVVSENLAEMIDLTVETGPLTTVEIEPATANVVSAVELPLRAQGLDRGGNPVPVALTWDVQGDSGKVTPEGVFSSDKAGPFTVLAKSGEIVGQATVEVLPGAATSLELTSEALSLIAGQEVQLQTTAVDAAGNAITRMPAWTVTSGIGSISETGVFTAKGAGTITITAKMDEATQTIELEVKAGALASIGITPATPTVTAGETQQFTATGYDAHKNPVPVEVKWSLHGALGRIDADTGLFTASKAGEGAVVAVNGALAGLTYVTVKPGKVVHLQIAPHLTVAAGEAVALEVSAVDAHQNPIQPELRWAMSEPLGQVIDGVFWGKTMGTTALTATSGEVEAKAMIDVTLGHLAHMQVTPSPDAIAAGKPVQLQVIGFDAHGNASPVDAIWSLSGEMGSLTKAGVFTPVKPGTGNVTVQADGLSTTLPLTVTPGPVHRLVLHPTQAQIASSTVQDFTVTAFDVAGNRIESDIHWALSADIGTLEQSGKFTGIKMGKGTLVAYAGGAVATAEIHVEPGPVTLIFVTPQPLSTTAGEQVTFVAQGFDAHHNLIPALQPRWRVTGHIGQIDAATGTFTAMHLGQGKVEVDIGGQIGSADVVIHPGTPDAQHSHLVASRLQLPADGTTTTDIIVYVEDRYGNPITNAQVTLLSNRDDKIDQPAPTNQHGITLGHVRSLTPGKSEIVAITESIRLNNPIQLTFKGEDAAG